MTKQNISRSPNGEPAGLHRADPERTVRLAIVDNSIDPEIYRPVEHWSRYLSVAWESFTAREHRFPDLERFTHVILTGSESSILEREAWVEEEADMVREAVGAGLAVLGSCWGHQLLAYALAGPGCVGRSAQPEIGWIRLLIREDGGLLGPPGPARVFSIHYDEVRNLDSRFEVLASTDLCPYQAIRFQGRPVWGLQFHPEVDVDAARIFIRDLLDRGFKGRPDLESALSSEPADSGIIHRIAASFVGAPPTLPGPGRRFSLDK
jgi:GMP synthase-like glutamine amidotransferase